MAGERARVAAAIDHTLLRPEATAQEVVALCEEATFLGVAAVCVSPSRLPLPSGALADGIGVAAVIGFPSGAHHSSIKAAEAARAAGEGATELDMVIDLGAALAGDWRTVEADIVAVRAAAPGTVLKVILEAALLTPPDLATACLTCEAAGADFVKTSTGFHPAGGATLDAVRLMAETVGGRLGVKAAGGIRTAEDALAYLDAGATRLGASRSAEILASLPA